MKVTNQERADIRRLYLQEKAQGLTHRQACINVANTLGRGVTTISDHTHDIHSNTVQTDLSAADEQSLETTLLRSVARLRRRSSDHNRQVRLLTDETVRLAEQVQEAYTPYREVLPLRLASSQRSANSDHKVLVALASDWHVGEKVVPSQVYHLNKYTPDIARRSSELFFTKITRRAQELAGNGQLSGFVLWLGGDFIGNYLHEEQRDSNYLTPEEEGYFAYTLLADGIRYLRSGLDLEDINILCNYGNHGRMTRHNYHVDGHRYNKESTIYLHLAHYFAHDTSIKFSIPEAYESVLRIHGSLYRFSHGHYVKYSANLDGAVQRYIDRANLSQPADFDCIGHYHNFRHNGSFQINGSTIGYNGYGKMLGLKPEIASQALLEVNGAGIVDLAHRVIVDDGRRLD